MPGRDFALNCAQLHQHLTNWIIVVNKMLKLLPGLTGAICAYLLLKLISWTGLTYEFAAYLIIYLLTTVLMDSAMRSYGK